MLSTLTIPELIDPHGFDCPCGKHHAVNIRYIRTGRGILNKVPEMLSALGGKHPFVLCDPNTYAAAGKAVCAVLKDAGVPYTLYVIPKEKPAPDEWTVGNVLMHFDKRCDLLLGVGSGVINDTCKEVAFKTGRVNAIVGTAPSMDGWASATSSMELDGVKVTIQNQCPQGILLDADVLARAPMRMLWAGYGDMLAKYVAICDWRLSALVTGEYYCEEIAELIRASLRRISANVDGLLAREPDAVLAVGEGLILAGLAMAFATVSRPASGLEHYFSHMWEMTAMQRHEPYDLHGIQVGVGTALSLCLYRDFLEKQKPDRERMLAHAAAFDAQAWEEQVRRVFGAAADEILRVEERVRKNDPDRLQRRIGVICEKWGDVLRIIGEELPEKDALLADMKKAGMPVWPKDLGLCAEDAQNAYLGARDIRDKYLSCSLLWDMGLEREAAEFVRELAE